MSGPLRTRHQPHEWWFFALTGAIFAVGAVATLGSNIPIVAVAFVLGSSAMFFMAGLLYGRRLLVLGKSATVAAFRPPDEE